VAHLFAMRLARQGRSADLLWPGNVMPIATEEEYYRAVQRESMAERLLVAARDQIFRDFQARTGFSILAYLTW
jgi:hypothetical protein